MELTKSFPPADALFDVLQEIDYKKHFHQFMDAIETLCLYTAAIVTVLIQKWNQYDCTERCQLAWMNFVTYAKKFVNWTQEKFIPFVIETSKNIHQLYVLFSSRQFVTL